MKDSSIWSLPMTEKIYGITRTLNKELTEAQKTFANKGKDRAKVKDAKKQRALIALEKVNASVIGRIDKKDAKARREFRAKRYKR